MTIAPRSFRYALDGATAVATITLNRPDRLNALTFEVYRELLEVFRALDTEPDVRAIVITGSGRAFCSGGDVEDIIGPLFEQDHEGLLEFTRMTCAVIRNMRRMPQPIIAAVQGAAAGGGFALALASDVRVAGESARMNAAFIRIGLTACDVGVSYFLPRHVGASVASELLLTGDFIHADRAERTGLVSAVVPDDELEAAGEELVSELREAPTIALGLTKSLLNQAFDHTVEAALTNEAFALELSSRTKDFNEGMAAFAEKRVPHYRGH